MKAKTSKLLTHLAAAVLAAPCTAMAADAPASPPPHTLTANVGFVTDYVFRGISQTSTNPAVQGGIDYSRASGLYAGIWGSNVSWIADSGAVATGSVTMELDTYFGFRNSFAGDFTYDIGFIRYNYPGSYTPAAGKAKADTSEVYLSFGYKWVSVKYSYGLGQFLTVPDARGTDYIEANVNIPLSDSGFTIGAHAGRQKYKGSSAAFVAAGGPNASYSDYKLSLSKDFYGFLLMLAYTDTNAPHPGFYTTLDNKDLARGAGFLSITRSF